MLLQTIPAPDKVPAWLLAVAGAAMAAALLALLAKLVRANLRRAPAASELAAILETCRNIQQAIDELKRTRAPFSDLAGSPAATAISRRAQVLRLARRGEKPEHISASLGIPLNEVAFMLKTAAAPQTSAASAN